jgi:hypothetical protein
MMRKYISTRKPGPSGNERKIMLVGLENGLIKTLKLRNRHEGYQGMTTTLINNLAVLREVWR